jgi:hypothetical protein
MTAITDWRLGKKRVRRSSRTGAIEASNDAAYFWAIRMGSASMTSTWPRSFRSLFVNGL